MLVSELLLTVRDVNGNLLENATVVKGKSGKTIGCHLSNALAPVTLEWVLDDKMSQVTHFNEPADKVSNFSAELTLNSKEVNKSITCRGYGRHTRNMNRSIFVFEEQRTSGEKESQHSA